MVCVCVSACGYGVHVCVCATCMCVTYVYGREDTNRENRGEREEVGGRSPEGSSYSTLQGGEINLKMPLLLGNRISCSPGWRGTGGGQ